MNGETAHVVRWKRYGHDRLYVTASDDTKLGFFDLAAEEPRPSSAEHLDVVVRAAHAWKEAQLATCAPAISTLLESRPSAKPNSFRTSPAPAPCSSAAPSNPTSYGPPPRPWIDLSNNDPGAAAREQAVAARNESPVATIVARAIGLHTEERAWRIGADGEEKVAAQLRKLAKKDPRWRSLHAIPVGSKGSDIDHLVVGPGGVFTLNTKNHPDATIYASGNTVMVNGHRTHYVRNSRFEAERAGRLLATALGRPVHVEGVIVIVNAPNVVVKKPAEQVHVVRRRQILQWTLGHGEILTQSECDAIYEVARRSTTWQP